MPEPLRCVLWSVVGPGSFALAARLAGSIEPGYRRRDEPISALAAKRSPAARVMIPGFLGLAVGSIGLAKELRGSPVAPDPAPALLALAGLTTAGAGLARCTTRRCPTRLLGDRDVALSDDLHAAFSGTSFALWIAIPLVAARPSRAVDQRYHWRCRCLAAMTLLAFLGAGMLTRLQSKAWSGAAQRLMLASALSWYPLAAITARSRNPVAAIPPTRVRFSRPSMAG